ncbi:hypothetical protein Lal_00012449, partial [Lupinus albus]
IMSLSRPFDFIKDVNDSKHLWKVVVRITQLWYVQVPPKPCHLEMILMDSKVSVKKNEFNQRSQSLLENKTYIMHNFNVLRNDLQFKACDHVYRMQFTADVIGVFDKLIFSQAQSNLKKVIFSMKDFCDDVISCTLWEAHAMKFLNFYNNQPSLQPLVILLTQFSTFGYSVNPVFNYLFYFVVQFSSLSLSCNTLSQSNTQLSQYSSLSDDNRFLYKAAVKSINEIPSHTSSKDITCVTVGTTTMFVVGRQGWYYDGCAKCTKKADVKDGPFTCKCGHFNQISIPRYKLEIKVNHDHSCGRFVFWDRQCADLIGISVSELKNQMLAVKMIQKHFRYARTMVLRVKVQPSYNQCSVIRLSEDPNLIKKIVDQLGVLQVIF